MPFEPHSQAWPSDRAILLVHGIGDYQPGDYERLKTALEASLGPEEWSQYAVYEMFWDPVSDWFKNRLEAAERFTTLLKQVNAFTDATAAGAAAAEAGCDVIWPVMVLDARMALRDACLLQLQQVVADGRQAGIKRRDMRISVIAHSLGCFHAYEMLCAAATVQKHELSTRLTELQLESVVMFASPVQLIRSVAHRIDTVVPKPSQLFTTRDRQLSVPGYLKGNGQFVPYVRRILSVTGDLDPVGGHLCRKRLDWAYMVLPGIDREVQKQAIVSWESDDTLVLAIQRALQNQRRWTLEPNNPHDWVRYVESNADLLRRWMLT